MPLPPALAARLAKRGIIKNAEAPTEKKAAEPSVETEAKSDAGAVTEEIIAESYDDSAAGALMDGTVEQQPAKAQVPGMMLMGVPPPPVLEQVSHPYHGFQLCPNKWNVYHDCSPVCKEIWGSIRPIDPNYDAKRHKMLAKYPLPDNWKEVLDQGIGRYYYWNMDRDLVSWLPPGHPKCSVSRSAADLRRMMHTERAQRLAVEASKEGAAKDSDQSSDSDTSDSDSEDEEKRKARNERKKRSHSVDGSEDSSSSTDSEDDSIPPPPPPSEPPSSRRVPPPPPSSPPPNLSNAPPPRSSMPPPKRSRGDNNSRAPRNAKGRATRDELDPMDPASYGDCPRGTWSSGLPDRTEAKTGVDTTASGQLYQQRPYPSPGTVLKVNAATPGPQKPADSTDKES